MIPDLWDEVLRAVSTREFPPPSLGFKHEPAGQLVLDLDCDTQQTALVAAIEHALAELREAISGHPLRRSAELRELAAPRTGRSDLAMEDWARKLAGEVARGVD